MEFFIGRAPEKRNNYRTEKVCKVKNINKVYSALPKISMGSAE